MVAFDASESLTPFEHSRDGRAVGYGSILFDSQRVQQVGQGWFDPAGWPGHARPVASGGRGAAWFVDAPFGAAVLRHYLRGGLAARISRDRYFWRGADRTRSFAEFRMLRTLHGLGLPVPPPIAACYWREGMGYRAAILIERLLAVRSLADIVATDPDTAPWADTGRMLARFHRAGLEHADLNAHNILCGVGAGQTWLIDFDKASLRIPETHWRERNLARLQRSLLKLRGSRPQPDVLLDFARLRRAYDDAWQRDF